MNSKYYQLIAALAGVGLSIQAQASVTFEICYDFGCRSNSEVTLAADEWGVVTNLFTADNAEDERTEIKLAIAQMEFLSGLHSPTHRDVARNLPFIESADNAGLFPGQMYCIDESINTTTYLALFEKHQLLQFHRVSERVYRRSILTQHWAAQIIDSATDQRYVLDSWFEDNGQMPALVSSERWHDLSLF